MSCEEVKPLLSAYMDGEMDSAKRPPVEAHVRTCPACSSALARLERVRDAVRGGGRRHQAPAHLRDRIRFSLRSAEYLERGEGRSKWKIWGSAAAALVIVTAGATSVLMNARNERRSVAVELLSAHERALVGRGVDVVSSDGHTVKPWFNGKLPFSPPVTDLSPEGFPLEGGRLDYAGGRPVAALVYKRRLHSIDVFVWPSQDAKEPPRHFDKNGYFEVSWAKNGFVFTAVSDLNQAELESFASLLQSR